MLNSKILQKIIWVGLIGAGLMITGCSDDAEITPDDHDVYTVTAVNAGDDMMSVSYSGQNQVYCYENEGCESGSGFTSWTIYPDDEVGLMSTDPERSAVGFVIEVNVSQGESYLEVEGFNIDSENMEVTDSEVILTTDVYSEDETISVSWGDTEGFEENGDR